MMLRLLKDEQFMLILSLWKYIDLHHVFLSRSEKRKRLLNSESDLNEDYPKENDSSR